MIMNEERIARERLEKLFALSLKHGAHADFERGVCAMEAVAWLAGEPHSDSPKCACPVVAALVRSWNDSLPTDEDRNRLLRPLVPKIVGTRGKTDALLLRRMWAVVDWQIRVYAPAFLRAAKLDEAARALESLPEIDSAERLVASEKETSAAESAAESVAESALQPTVSSLQSSMVALIERLCDMKDD